MTLTDQLVLWMRDKAHLTVQFLRALSVFERIVLTVFLVNAVVLQVLLWRQPDGPDLHSFADAANAVLAFAVIFVLLVNSVIDRANAVNNRARLMRLLESRPSGAPRIAEVTCRHGDRHRYQYAHHGWEPIGPAVASLDTEDT